MHMATQAHAPLSLAAEIAAATGIRASRCYQCGKCTAGCPMVPDMDFTPSQILRLVQLDRRETVLAARTPWFCASCLTCSARCPQEVEIAALMDALRQRALAAGKAPAAARKVRAFAAAFLRGVERQGRLHEMSMAIDYKLRSRDYLGDLLLAPRMLAKGKLKPFARSIRGKAELRRLFAAAAERH
jgi:heterodisulfide reductase subunit C2